MVEQSDAEVLAQSLARKYQAMRYSLGSVKKHSFSDFYIHLEEAKQKLGKQEYERMEQRCHELVGLSGDGKTMHDKLLKDFPGSDLS